MMSWSASIPSANARRLALGLGIVSLWAGLVLIARQMHGAAAPANTLGASFFLFSSALAFAFFGLRRFEVVEDKVTPGRSPSGRERLQPDAREKASLLQLMMDHSPVIFAVKDLRGRYLLVNREFEACTQLSRSEVIGRSDRQLFPEELARSIEKMDRQLIDSGTAFSIEEKIEYRGKQRWFLSTRGLARRDGKAPPLICIISQDVTEKKETELALQDLASIVESSDDAILSLSLEGTVLTWNPGATRLFGYDPEEIVGKSAFQLIPLGRGKELQENLKRTSNGERIRAFRTIRMRKDGSLVEVSLSMSPVRDAQGKVRHASWICRDVSMQNQADALVRQLSRVVEQTADLVMITDDRGVIEYVNPAFERTTGFAKEEALGKKANIMKSGAYDRAFYEELWKTITSGKPFQSAITNKRKDGSLYYAEKTITPLKDLSGKITHYVSTDKDVTERRKIENEYLQAQKRFQLIFNHASDAIAYCDIEGTFLEANDAFSKLTGYSREELIKKRKYQNICSQREWEYGNRLLGRLLATGEATAYEKDYLRKDGAPVSVLLTAFPVRNGEGSSPPIQAIGVIARDISERKRYERELQAISTELKRSNADLEQFASVASHDLEEPLRTISSHLKVLERKVSLDAESRGCVDFAVDASTRLRELIHDLLTYSRVGSPLLKRVNVDCDALFSEVISYLDHDWQKSGIEISHAPLPTVSADPSQLSLVFQNLVSNAIKYRKPSVPPKVHVGIARREGEWCFSVEDNGIGIPKEEIPNLFVMFRRLHTRSEYPGTGIGLALCKKIIETHGGRIWVESEPGRGSTFFFLLPAEPREAELGHGSTLKSVGGTT